MRQLQRRALSRVRRLDIFTSGQLEIYDTLLQRAQNKIEQIKQAYRGKTISFEYGGETITGEFVTAVEGNFPGTYMVVLQIASSRLCSGPCMIHLQGERVGGIIVTGNDGQVGITIKARPRRQSAAHFLGRVELARCA